MNRLCLGALGLLLGLFATCYAKDIVLADYQEESYKLNAGEQNGLSELLNDTRSKQYRFIVEATILLYGNGMHKHMTDQHIEAKERVMGLLEGMNDPLPADYDKSGKLDDRLTKLKELGGKNLDTLKNGRILAYQCARLYHYVASMKDSFLTQLDSLVFPMMKEFIGEFENVAQEQEGYRMPDPNHVNENNQHYTDWSKEKWDEIYQSLPEIKKYFASGLKPATKDRLNKNLKIVEDETEYKMKKQMSEQHIDHIAIQARLEAIKHSHTAAGQYFSTHENWIHEKLAKINQQMEEQHRHMNEEE